MFSGQLFDALATPIAGLLSDTTKGFPAQGIGGRMFWYIVGTCLAIVSFMGVFAFSPFAHRSDSVLCIVYFASCASAFNVAWAAVQVCHLAMIPELTRTDGERVRLVRMRYAATILSSLLVFLLYLYGPRGGEGTGVRRFKVMTMVVLTVGAVSSLGFVWGVGGHNKKKFEREEKRRMWEEDEGEREEEEEEGSGTVSAAAVAAAAAAAAAAVSTATTAKIKEGYNSMDESQPQITLPPHSRATSLSTIPPSSPSSSLPHSTSPPPPSPPPRLRGPRREWHDWFRVRDFYLAGVVYMCSRIVVNITQVCPPSLPPSPPPFFFSADHPQPN